MRVGYVADLGPGAGHHTLGPLVVSDTEADLRRVAKRRTELLRRALPFVPESDPLAAEIREALR